MLTKADMHGYQNRTVDRIFEHDNSLVIVPMGGGKTVSTLTAAQELLEEGIIDQVWVVAPKRVALSVWATEHLEWAHLLGLRVSVVVGTQAKRLKAIKAEADVYVVNTDVLQWLLEIMGALPERTLFVIDELSRFQNHRAKRTKALRKLMARVLMRVGLTGTPKPKDIEGLFMQVLLVKGPKLWGDNFYAWRSKHFTPIDNDGHMWVPMAGRGPYLDAQFAKQCFIISEEELGKAHITPVMRYRKIDIGQVAKQQHDKALKGYILELKEQGVKNLLGSMAIGSSKARQIASGFVYDEHKVQHTSHTAKLDELKEMVEDIGEPVMICYEFLPELDAIKGAFPGIKVIGDGATDAEIAEAERAWNAGELDWIAIHPASAGHGLNLQHGGRHMIWFTLPWSLEAYRQTIRRIARQGQKKTVFVHHLIARGTIEETLVLPRLQERGDAEDSLKALIHMYQNQ